MKLKLTRRSMITKLIITYLVLILPVMTAAIILNSHLRKQETEQILSSTDNYTSQIESTLNLKVRIAQTALSTLSSNYDVLLFASQTTAKEAYSDAFVYTTILTELRRLVSDVKVHSELYRVMLHFGAENLPDVKNTMCYDPDIKNGMWAEHLAELKENGYFNGVDIYLEYRNVPHFRDKNKQEFALCLYRPIYDEFHSSIIAICEVQILVKDLISDIENTADNSLFSSIALVSNDVELLPSNDIDALSKDFVDGETYESDDTKYYIKVQDCPSIASKIIVPIANIDAITINSSRLFILALLSAVFVTIVVLSFSLSRYVLRGLQRLSEAITELSDGDFTKRINVDRRSVKASEEIYSIANQFNSMIDRIENLMKEIDKAHEAEKSAIYGAMQVQIQPHFICNALNMIRTRVSHDPSLELSLSRLITYFRYNSSQGSPLRSGIGCVTLEDEVNNLRDYIDIVNQIRYKEKDVANQITLNVQIDTTYSLNKCTVTKFILQPLAENAVIHGFPNGAGGNISVCICDDALSPDYIKLTFSDNGIGMDSEALAQIKSTLYSGTDSGKVGLRNIANRITYAYGKDSFSIQSVKNFGTMITLRFPYEELNHQI